MWVEQMVKECDFTGKKYDTPQKGAGGIAQGCTGRWCVVMHAGPEYVKEHDIDPVPLEVARQKVEARCYGWADF